jgi:hypothetical protein
MTHIGNGPDLQGEDGLVPVGKVGVHGHDDAVGYDGEDDQILKRWPAHKPDEHPPG